MKIILAADGSECTQRAMAFLVAPDGIAGPDDEIVVLNVQSPLPPRVAPLVGFEVVRDFHRDEAEKVLVPIRQFLDLHALRYRCEWVVGSPAVEIVNAVRRVDARMIVMGTHGHGLIGRMVMGSVAQRVVADSSVPVLLVK